MRLALRLVLVLFALTWWIAPAMGAIDLSVTWNEDWPVMLEAGWGLLFSGLGLSLVVAAIAPRLAPAALVHLAATAGCLLVSALIAQEPETWWIFAMLAVQLPFVWGLAGGMPDFVVERSNPLAALTIVALPFGLAYWWTMAADNRLDLPNSDITNDVDHYAVQAALGLALVVLPALATYLPEVRRLLGTITALMAGYLGVVSWFWQGQPGGFDRGLSAALVVWSAAVVVASWTAPSGATTRVRDRSSGGMTLQHEP